MALASTKMAASASGAEKASNAALLYLVLISRKAILASVDYSINFLPLLVGERMLLRGRAVSAREGMKHL